jgi:2-desacetyl-2-hydroxyethyl bacteriochlorophyllide A dehydrogenase
MPLDWDNTCPACKAGHKHICQNLNFVGIDSPGALQTLWNVKSNWVFKVPTDVSLRDAALVEPVAVAVHDVKRAELEVNDKVLILGGGPIGLLIGIVARNKGADVRIVEPDESRVGLISSLGFDVINPKSSDVAELVNSWTHGKGADAIFEVSGAASAVLPSVEYLKVRGKLIIVAIHPQPREMNLQRVFWRELTIIGVRVYEPEDFQTAIDLISAGTIPADDIITHVIPLKGIMSGFSIIEKGLAMKVLIDVQNEAEMA